MALDIILSPVQGLGFWRDDVYDAGFPHLLESPGLLFLKFPRPGKSSKVSLVLEAPGN